MITTIILGAGDMASGVAMRLRRVGLQVVMTELPKPLAVRRTVSFAEAVFTGETTIEGITARRVADPTDNFRIIQVLAKGFIPVLIDPEALSIHSMHPGVIVDARMRKQRAELLGSAGMVIIGLGPGFEAGVNCTAVIETIRGHKLGRVYAQGSAESDTRLPDPVGSYREERVLRAPADGELIPHAQIGDHLESGQLIAEVAGQQVIAPFKGILRGLIHPSVPVISGMKIGDLDPRDDPSLVSLVSEKALAVGAGVLEVILSRPNLRTHLWA
jgi:xanthine dehydrogenase accessory factor